MDARSVGSVGVSPVGETTDGAEPAEKLSGWVGPWVGPGIPAPPAAGSFPNAASANPATPNRATSTTTIPATVAKPDGRPRRRVVTRAVRTAVLTGSGALPVAGHGVSTTVAPARTGHETSRSGAGSGPAAGAGFDDDDAAATGTAAVAAAAAGLPRRGSFGALVDLATVAVATAAGAGVTSARGTTVVGTAVARLNGAQRRHDARTRFQQFGQTARAHDVHSRNGAIDSSPSWSRSRPHCSQNRAEDTPNPSIDERSPGSPATSTQG